MVDQFTSVVTKGYGSRIINSIKGIVVGLILFVASFGVLFVNEGRVDQSKIAKKSLEISGSELPRDKSEFFASVTGPVTTEESLGDGSMLLAGKYLSISKQAEMYAWVEKAEEKSETSMGGSETTTTTYTYVKEWTAKPADSSTFHESASHHNPPMTAVSGNYQVGTMKVGVYSLDGKSVSLPAGDKLPLTSTMLALPVGATIAGDAVYLNGASVSAPVIGDQRVSYSALTPGFQGTVFGKYMYGSSITKYTDDKGRGMDYRVFEGDRAAALATMHGEFVMMLWLIRALGFLMMWIGLSMVLSPLAVILDFFPLLGSLGKMAINLLTFAIAVPLSLITIVISAIVHNVVVLIVVISVSLASLGYIFYKQWASRKA